MQGRSVFRLLKLLLSLPKVTGSTWRAVRPGDVALDSTLVGSGPRRGPLDAEGKEPKRKAGLGFQVSVNPVSCMTLDESLNPPGPWHPCLYVFSYAVHPAGCSNNWVCLLLTDTQSPGQWNVLRGHGYKGKGWPVEYTREGLESRI